MLCTSVRQRECGRLDDGRHAERQRQSAGASEWGGAAARLDEPSNRELPRVPSHHRPHPIESHPEERDGAERHEHAERDVPQRVAERDQDRALAAGDRLGESDDDRAGGLHGGQQLCDAWEFDDAERIAIHAGDSRVDEVADDGAVGQSYRVASHRKFKFCLSFRIGMSIFPTSCACSVNSAIARVPGHCILRACASPDGQVVNRAPCPP